MFLSDKQLAHRWGVTRQTVWRWHRNDVCFPSPVKLSSGCTRWRLPDILQWESKAISEPKRTASATNTENAPADQRKEIPRWAS